MSVSVGQRSEDTGQPAAGPGVFRQGQVVQHPGSWLEPAHPPPGRCPHSPPAHSPGLVSGLLRLLRRGRLPKLHETLQLVDEGEGRKTIRKQQNVNPFTLPD